MRQRGDGDERTTTSSASSKLAPAPPQLAELAAYLDAALANADFGDDPHGVYRPSTRPVRRLGLALEPALGLDAWVRHERLDALFLHRPWRLPSDASDALPADVGVLASHLAFDARLTFGFNPRLAQALGMRALEPFGPRSPAPVGMVGVLGNQGDIAEGNDRAGAHDSPPDHVTLLARVAAVFGVAPVVRSPQEADGAALNGREREPVRRVVVAGAMTEALIQEAAARGAQVYVTGQLRQSALEAVRATGVIVAAVGHTPGERWGLWALAGMLRERWAGLETVLWPGDAMQGRNEASRPYEGRYQTS